MVEIKTNIKFSPYGFYGYDTWIFDLDGTLVDSHAQIQSLLMSSVYFHTGLGPEPKRLESLIGLSLGQMLAELEIPEKFKGEVAKTFRSNLIEQVKLGNTLFEGVFEFLHKLKCHSVKVGVATNKPDLVAQLVVENSRINGLVDSIVGSTHFPPKPAPHIIQQCNLELSGINPIMIGDRKEDLLSARSAGVDFIGITNSEELRTQFASYGAKLILKSFSELVAL